MSSWHHGDLTGAAGAPSAAGYPSGYGFDSQGTQHVVHIGFDHHIHELWWRVTDGWHHHDLTKASRAPDAGSDPSGYVFAAEGTQHVIYRDNGDEDNGHIYELSWGADQSVNHTDLTKASKAPAALLGTRPSGYVFDADGTQHVIYRAGPIATNDHIYELSWGADPGVNHTDLIKASGAPDATQNNNSPCGYVFAAQGTQHVVYISTNGGIHELWWGADPGVNHTDLTGASGAFAAFSNPSGYVFAAEGTQHVVYNSGDGHIQELWWRADGRVHHNDLTSATDATRAAGDPSGYVFAAQGTQHVVYCGVDSHIHELWWRASDGWHHNDLTAATRGPDARGTPSGYVFAAQGTQHVVYLGNDRHIHELWWG
jgi:hypothetical protein